MKIIEYKVDLLPDTAATDLPDKSRPLFFDIETTGFSAASTHLYLIGCIYEKNDEWLLKQWFLENPREEREALELFSEFLTDFDTLIHFNGSGFDIPYLNKKYEKYKLRSPFPDMKSIDIYKLLMPFKKLLGMTSLKQKAFEQYMGIGREDIFTGGDLIAVYEDYVEYRQPDALNLLLLHNHDDIIGMTKLLPMLYYPRLFSEAPQFLSTEIHDYRSVQNNEARELFLEFKYPFSVPVALKLFTGSDIFAFFEADRLRLRVPIINAELKYFYPNYRDYYYLPLEDCAMHKSVAQFVDKNYRIQAKANTCYLKKQSAFIPVSVGCNAPVFRESFESKQLFCELSEAADTKNTAFFNEYIYCLLKELCTK